MKRKNILNSISHSELVSESDNRNNFTRVRSRNKFGMAKNVKAAFTLAEVLITLLIIGVVAALTLPTLMQNISDRKNSTKVAVFNSKFIQGLNLTKNAGEMGTQYSSTYDFLKNGLSNHLKMAAICDSDHLKDCLGYDEIKYEMKSGKEKTVKVSSLKTADKLNVKDAGFEDTASFIMGDGTPVLLTYNLNCMDDGGVDKTISSCVAGLFDINGSSKPNMFINKVTKLKNGTIKSEAHDIRSFNGASVSDCVGILGNLCIAKGAAFKSSQNNGEEAAYCENLGYRIPSLAELAQIASALYGENFSDDTSMSGLTMKNKDMVYSALGITDNPETFDLVSSNHDAGYGASFRVFSQTGSSTAWNGVSNLHRIICVK